jgi:glycosyltransferase involved in cell wall biosynthesis
MFSVVIPLYNKELSIVSTLESVLNQNLTNFEILIIDDGSTDKSLENIKVLKDDRISIFKKKNGGVSSARNLGIKKAKYKWIAFLDGDDLWLSNHLTTLNYLVQKYPEEKVFCTSYKLSTSLEKDNNQSGVYTIENYFKGIQLNNDLICSSCALVHKSCFDFVGGFNENLKRGEDLEMWYRLGKSFNFTKSEAVTAIYRLDTENRAMARKSKFEESFASIISFKNIANPDEEKYLKKQIRAKFKSCLYSKEWSSLLKLIIKFNYRLI